jgi:CheY-like chemotaxis protein
MPIADPAEGRDPFIGSCLSTPFLAARAFQQPMSVLLLAPDLPNEAPDISLERASSSQLLPQSPCEVLVVDDDSSILQSVAQALELEGYQVRTARNGAEALTVLEQWGSHLILLDMRMPVMDGWEFAEMVRARGLKPKIVVMTATTDAADWARQIGADGYLAKPFELDAVFNIVEELCTE